MTTWTIKTADDGEGGWMAEDQDGFILDYFTTEAEARKAVREQEALAEVERIAGELVGLGVEIPDGLYDNDPASLPGLRAILARTSAEAACN